MSTVYCYGRVSTRNQKDKMTKADQEEACRLYFEDKLAHFPGVQYGGFIFDEAESGGKAFSERKEGRTLYHSLQKGDAVICYDYSRLCRDTDDWVPMRKDFKHRGVSVHFVHDAFASVQSAATKKFGMDVMIAAATLMREEASEARIKRIEEKRERGVPVSHCAAPGWKIVGEGIRRRYRVDDRERQIIDVMATLKSEGMSHFQIGRWMDRRTTKKQLQPKRYRGFTDERYVRWALRARECGYPRDITSRKQFERAWRQGTIKACHPVS